VVACNVADRQLPQGYFILGIHHDLGITQKTAWFMLQRVHLAMQDDLTGGMLGGEVEVYESFIGGRPATCIRTAKIGL
jgi:hypothetical protein